MMAARPRTDAMKLIVAVVRGQDRDDVMRALIRRGFHATLIDDEGGFFSEGNATVFLGVQAEYVPDALDILRRTARSGTRYVDPGMPLAEPVDVSLGDMIPIAEGGASLFLFDVARYERIA